MAGRPEFELRVSFDVHVSDTLMCRDVHPETGPLNVPPERIGMIRAHSPHQERIQN